MDLAYYESPPGIQLLHCMEFPAAVKGGDSTFYDTFVLAELLREREPEAFATLVRVAATFQKSHAERERPAQMFYTRPHIVTDTGGAAGDGDSLAVLISCVGRKLILGQRIDEEVEAVRDVLGDATSITGFYSYGEISPLLESATCELHNQTMTITTLSEM